jgi:hypothetical protein
MALCTKAFPRTFRCYLAIWRQGVNPNIPPQFAGRRHSKYSKQSKIPEQRRGLKSCTAPISLLWYFPAVTGSFSDTPHDRISFIDCVGKTSSSIGRSGVRYNSRVGPGPKTHQPLKTPVDPRRRSQSSLNLRRLISQELRALNRARSDIYLHSPLITIADSSIWERHSTPQKVMPSLITNARN